MRSIVRTAFPKWVEQFESRVNYMYLDIGDLNDLSVPGRVTTGLGDLIDTPKEATDLEWARPDGSIASYEEVFGAWCDVRNSQSIRRQGGAAFARLTTIRLTEASLDALIDARMAANCAMTDRYIPNFEALNANGQLGIMSLDWAMGAAFEPHFPSFVRAVNASPPDWVAAADQCHMVNGNPSRNAANKALFMTASMVDATGLDPDQLYGI